MDTPKRCANCSTFYLPHEHQQHQNMHTGPSKLTPRTQPNDLGKVRFADLAIQESASSEIALRSLLPEQVLLPQQQRKVVPIIEGENAHQLSQVVRFPDTNYRLVRDRLDLSSAIADSDLSKDTLSKLLIKKEVDLAPTKTLLPKKEIHKFKNVYYAARETTELGGCAKKLPPLHSAVAPQEYHNLDSSEESRKFDCAEEQGKSGWTFGKPWFGSEVAQRENELGYEVKTDHSLLANSHKKSIVVFHRRTLPAADYVPVDTISHRSSQELAHRRSHQVSSSSHQSSKIDSLNSSNFAKPFPNPPHPLHTHECPSCHGFFCPYCHSTLPPHYRPFLDPHESPALVSHYRSRPRVDRESQKLGRQECQCERHPQR